MRRVLAVVGVVIATLSVPATALAHTSNPKTETIIRRVTPQTPGLTLTVLDRNDRFQLLYRGSKTIIIYGYSGDEYARFLPGGIVQVNHNSPAYYLNVDAAGTATVPASVDIDSPPDWQTVDKAGRFEWHDHRMHWMGTGVPPQVKNTSLRTKVFDYSIPITIGGTKGAITGTLWWIPSHQSGPPIAAIVVLVLVLLASAALVVWVRRRRRDEEAGGDGPDGSGTGAGGDAAPTPPRPERPIVEAW